MDDIRSVPRWKCKFDEDENLIQLPQVSGGWDFGRTLDVVCQEGRFYVVRRKGHTAWSGVGMTRYYSTEYLLLEVKIEEKRVNFVILEQEETENRPWREIRRDMFAKAKRLHEAYTTTYCICEKPKITHRAHPPMCLLCGRLER